MLIHSIVAAHLTKKTYRFNFPAGTSRGVLTEKDSFFIYLKNATGQVGIGECSIIKGLSCDDRPDYEATVERVVKEVKHNGNMLQELFEFPSIQFGLESAWLNLQQGGGNMVFPSAFTEKKMGIPINGLIWMGTQEAMWKQVEQKLEEGYSCIKLKIGAIDFEAEHKILNQIRARYDASVLTLRVDANGAFDYDKGLEVCERLHALQIHSIEQPIKTKDLDRYQQFCKQSATPVALDEQLIGVFSEEAKTELLQTIQPAYIVLKPSLHGGFAGCDEWITLAEKEKIGWWMTSALESNIGLNAIAQYTATKNVNLPQGLGTGKIYENNEEATTRIENGVMWFR